MHNLAANTIATVGSAESCANGSLASTQVGPYVAQAVPAATMGLVVAGVVGAIVIGGAIGDSDNDTRIQLPPPPSP